MSVVERVHMSSLGRGDDTGADSTIAGGDTGRSRSRKPADGGSSTG
jgi:hypothetical protein